ncbi:MAG: endonuclease [Candidatus Eisenbacteria bacterium]
MAVSRFSRVFAVLTVFAMAVAGCSDDVGFRPNESSQGGPGGGSVPSAEPPGYYSAVDASTPATLRQTLHEIIDDHLRFPYTSTSTDTWNILELADEDPNDPGSILDIYKNASYTKAGGGNSFYNREHAWPKSYGFPNDVSTNYPYTDCHHLFLADSGYNSSRSNKPYRYCDAACGENPTVVNNGQGGGSGGYPGNSNWTSGSFTAGTWETWVGRRGDVARALFYMDVRYEGGVHGITGAPEPDLILTDDEALIAASNTGSNESVGYMGMLSVLLLWSAEDPVDTVEMAHNDAVFAFQGNRNPFVDHPEWIACIFQAVCDGGGGGDTTPPGSPTGLVATAGDGSVDLDWADNGESDLAGYNVFRATTAGGPYSQVNGLTVSASAYHDGGLSNGTTYFYVVTAVDLSGNESGNSGEASATPAGGGGGVAGVPWINEFHYDNASTDTGEFVEVAGPAGTSLSGWQIIGYNGNGGGTYKTVALSGSIPDQQGGFGTLAFAFTGMQNGSPDALALVDDAGAVVEFLSYEGSFVATSGPAAGMTSGDVGVSETSSTPVGYSLQRSGTGATGTDFTWQSPQSATEGTPNAGQTFQGGGGDTTPPSAPSLLAATAGDGSVDVDWADNGEPDLAGYNVYRATSSGGPYAQINAVIVSSSFMTDSDVTNGTTYYYVVTALDVVGNESGYSNEASATPVDMTPPAAPTSLVAAAGDGSVDLDWSNNGEPDLAGYNVYRATSSGGPYSQLNGSLLAASLYTDATVANGTTYYYVVTAQDATGNESAAGNEATATPVSPGGDPVVWINELHYDNSGRDTGEFAEVAGTAGTDLTGWQLLGYNGSDGSVYRTVNLSGTVPNQQAGFGTRSFSMGLQNGSPDGIALVDPQGNVVQFLSYEGSFTATSGRRVRDDVDGHRRCRGKRNSRRLFPQLAGTGTSPADFTWQTPSSATAGVPNSGQTFGGALTASGRGPPTPSDRPQDDVTRTGGRLREKSPVLASAVLSSRSFASSSLVCPAGAGGPHAETRSRSPRSLRLRVGALDRPDDRRGCAVLPVPPSTGRFRRSPGVHQRG